jgi:hypothetical protein
LIARRKLADLLLLLVPLGGLTALSAGFGVAGPESVRFGAAFAAFLLPGWLLSLRIVPRAEQGVLGSRLCVALFVSYALYAVCALACRFAGWGYGTFAAFLALASAGAAASWWRTDSCGTSSAVRRHWREIAVVGLAAILAAACFSHPYSDDVALFEFNTLESFEQRNFEPSALDVRPHGLSEAQPRMRANLLHAGIGLSAAVTDVSPRLLLYAVAPPFFGFFIPLALGFFVGTVTRASVDPVLVLLAVIAPWSLCYPGFDVHWYEFQVLNNAVLDKAFAGWVLLPVALAFSWRFLATGEWRWLALVLAGLPGLVWTHPLAPTYFFASCGALGLAAFRQGTWKRCLALAACGALGFALVVTTVDPASTQRAVPELASLDLAQGGPHLWPGHYTQRGHHEASGVEYDGDGRPFLKPKNFFGSGLVRGSLALALVWTALYGLRRSRSRREPTGRTLPLEIGGVALSCLAAVALAASRLQMSPALLAGAAAVALAGLGLIAVASWRRARDNGEDAAEAAAFRLQGTYAGALVLLYTVGSALLTPAPHLAAGLSRTGWLYLGFFPFLYVAQYAWRGLAGAIDRLQAGAHPSALVAALPVLAVGLHVIDQAQAIQRQSLPVLTRLGIGSSVVDQWWHHRRPLTERVAELDAGKGARAPFDRPAWLRDGDRVLLTPHDDFTFAGKYELMKRSVFYREMYAEATAFQALGFGFLESFTAYNDFSDGRLTPRLRHWIEREGVTVLMWVPNEVMRREAFERVVGELRAQRPGRVRAIAPGVFRIGGERS